MMEISGQISSDKVNALIAKYNQVCAESTRYRGLEWQITAWAVALLVGTAHLVTQELDALSCRVQFAAILVVLATWAAGCCHLGYIHQRLTHTRKLCAHIEEMLGFNAIGVYESGLAVIAPELRGKPARFSVGIWHVGSWFALMTLVGAFAVYAIDIHPTVGN